MILPPNVKASLRDLRDTIETHLGEDEAATIIGLLDADRLRETREYLVGKLDAILVEPKSRKGK